MLPLRLLAAAHASGANGSDDLRGAGDADEGLTVVDLCAGKGYLAMCLGHGAIPTTGSRNVVRRVVMLEKARVNWDHLPTGGGGKGGEPSPGCPGVEVWGPRTNIFDEEVLTRLAGLPGRVVIIGIHLCKRLASRAVELYNLLGPRKAVALVLAPCCIPTASGVIEISAPVAVPSNRIISDSSSGDMADSALFLGLWSCPASAQWSRGDRVEGPLFCWNCGEVGHAKPACADTPTGLTKGQIRRRRKYANRRSAGRIDTAAVAVADRPFEAWAAGLRAAVVTPMVAAEVTPTVEGGDGPTPAADAAPVLLVTLPTTGAGGEHDGVERGDRKLSWILAGSATGWWDACTASEPA